MYPMAIHMCPICASAHKWALIGTIMSQCPSVPHTSATYQCRLSVPIISATSSVPISAAVSVPVSAAISVPVIEGENVLIYKKF
ncbi:hypothetical protein AB205_0165770 [Aquarana catesbeiana]|uniref:Uncharacterized protein n=1 Tax=Aquarana catesbeiana TaxID=8400 RepID=A0A2G9SLY3_AQUCT|nr:hypothetical protein AB205_0165770 [Aquarana catesbeiana]